MADIDTSKLSIQQILALAAGKPLPPPQDAIDIAASTPEVPSTLVKVGRGAADITQGIKQKYLNVTDPQAAEEFTKQTNQEIAAYEKGRAQGAPDGAGYDFSRLAGNIAMGSPLMLTPAGGVGLLGRGASGMVSGAAGGYAGFDPTNTTQSNLINAGVSGLAGGVLNAAAPRVVQGVVSGAQFAKNKLAEGLRSLIPETQVINNVRVALKTNGIDFDALAQGVKNSLVEDAKKQISFNGKLDPEMLARKMDIEAVAGPGMGTSAQISKNPAQWTSEQNIQKIEANLPSVQREESGTLTQRFQQQDVAQKSYAQRLADQMREIPDTLFGTNPKSAQPTTPLQASEAVIKTIQEKDAKAGQAVTELYDAYKAHGVGDTTSLPTRKLADIAGKIADEFGVENIPTPVLNRLKDFGLFDGKQIKVLTINEADKLNRLINNNNPGFGPVSSALKPIKQALNESLLEIPEAGASKALLTARKAAAERFAEQETGKSVTDAINNVAPDRFFEQNILRGNVRDIQALKESLSKTGEGAAPWHNLRTEAFNWAINKATSSGDKAFNGMTFKRALNEIGEDRLKTLFSPNELAQIKTLERGSLAMTAEPAFAAPSRSNTTPQLMGELLGLGMRTPGLNLAVKPIAEEMALGASQKRLAAALSGEGAANIGRDQAQAALRNKIMSIIEKPSIGAVAPSTIQQKR